MNSRCGCGSPQTELTLIKRMGLTWDTAEHCGSCHVDQDDYDYTLASITVDGERIETCCSVRKAYQEWEAQRARG